MLNPKLVTVRQSTETDSDLVFRIKEAAFRRYVEQTWGWDDAAQRAKHRENFDPSTIQILSYKGVDIGWIGVERKDHAIRVVNIHIVPESRGLGIGTLVLQRILDEAAERRVSVILRVLKVNPRARALYQRLGFSVTSDSETHYYMEARP